MYLKDYVEKFEYTCEKLDLINPVTDFSNIKSRIIEFFTLICELKIALSKAKKFDTFTVSNSKDFKEKILKYENILEFMKAQNNRIFPFCGRYFRLFSLT